MTATLINMLAAPAAAEMTGLAVTPGIPAGPDVATQPGGPQSFATAMQALESPHTDGGSDSLLPSTLAVTGTGTTVPATSLDLALPALPSAPLTDGAVAELPDNVVSLNWPAGNGLPEVGNPLPDSGNVLPPVAVQSGLQPLVPSDGTTTATTASAAMLPQTIPDATTQAGLTNLTPQSLLPGRQLSPEAHTSGPTIVNADESSALTPQITSVPKPELEFVSQNQVQAQRAFESLSMYSESAATGMATENLTTMSGDSGPVGFAQPTSQSPLQLNQLIDLPQFQNMRPLNPMADPKAFMEGLGQRLMIMSEGGVQSARLKLYPENLGTLDIKIQVEDNVARVWFTADHGQAREALESALPKLKELFSQQGMELIQADVGSDQDRQPASEAFAHTDDFFSGTAVSDPDNESEPVRLPHIMMAAERSLDIYV